VDEYHKGRYREFLKDIYLLCRKHCVEIDGRFDAPCEVRLDGALAMRLFVNAEEAFCDDDGHVLIHQA